MTHHFASCLRGPITQTRGCWLPTADDLESASNDVPRLSDPDIRADLVRRVRRAIADGTYDTPEKWQEALDRLQDSME